MFPAAAAAAATVYVCVQELRKTLQDGHAVIELVRTLRGAKCEEATFEPPTQKPATIKGRDISVCVD